MDIFNSIGNRQLKTTFLNKYGHFCLILKFIWLSEPCKWVKKQQINAFFHITINFRCKGLVKGKLCSSFSRCFTRYYRFYITLKNRSTPSRSADVLTKFDHLLNKKCIFSYLKLTWLALLIILWLNFPVFFYVNRMLPLLTKKSHLYVSFCILKQSVQCTVFTWFSSSSPIVVFLSLFFCSQFLRSLNAFWFLKLIRKSTLISTQYTNMDLDWISFHSCISFPFLPADKLRHLFGVLVLFIAHFMVWFTLKHKRYRGIGLGWNFLHTKLQKLCQTINVYFINKCLLKVFLIFYFLLWRSRIKMILFFGNTLQ